MMTLKGTRKSVRLTCMASLAALFSTSMVMAAVDLDERRGNRATTNAFGTTSETVTTVGAMDFVAATQSEGTGTEITVVPGLFRDVSQAATLDGGYVLAPVDGLPSGALVNAIELEHCDDSDASEIGFQLESCVFGAGGCDTVADGSTGILFADGCSFVEVELDPAITVDNFNNNYVAAIVDGDESPDTRWRAIRVYWQRQISPAPDTATFADVPTDSPFFRAIEALASSGITSGCGGDLYCPTDPVTREQMAVFLARALGLHFPN